jgi:hypothetical protein
MRGAVEVRGVPGDDFDHHLASVSSALPMILMGKSQGNSRRVSLYDAMSAFAHYGVLEILIPLPHPLADRAGFAVPTGLPSSVVIARLPWSMTSSRPRRRCEVQFPEFHAFPAVDRAFGQFEDDIVGDAGQHQLGLGRCEQARHP